MIARLALQSATALIAAFLVLPVLAIVPVAFDAHTTLRLPPDAWSMRWWGVFFADASWRRALLASLQIAVLVTLVTVVAGTAAALGLARISRGLRLVAGAVLVGPVVTPTIVLAVALYAVARGTGLVGTVTGLVLAHSVLALPYAVLNVGVSVNGLDPRLGLAAAGLGAGPWRVFCAVTLPLIAPGVMGGGIFAFVTSFDEIVLSIFLAGPATKTLPVRMWEEIRVELTPVIAVAASVMIALAVLAGGAGVAVRRRSRKPVETPDIKERTRC